VTTFGATIAAVTLATAAWATTAGTAYADPPPPPAPGPAPGPVAAMDHDGTYAVGTEIAPGTYTSAGPTEGGACYWKRQGGPAGTDILDNALTKQPQIVQIQPTDTSFKTTGCQPWALTEAPPPAPGNPLLELFQLRGLMGTVNAGAGQIGLPPLPGP